MSLVSQEVIDQINSHGSKLTNLIGKGPERVTTNLSIPGDELRAGSVKEIDLFCAGGFYLKFDWLCRGDYSLTFEIIFARDQSDQHSTTRYSLYLKIDHEYYGASINVRYLDDNDITRAVNEFKEIN